MLDKILDFIAEQLTAIKSKLGADSYKTVNWSFDSSGQWKCEKTGIVLCDCQPADTSASYLYIEDVTDNVTVFAYYQAGTAAKYSGQFIAIKGHTYRRAQAANIAGASSHFKYTTPTGSGGVL